MRTSICAGGICADFLLTVAAGRDVRCILQGSGDCWARSTVRCPNQRACVASPRAAAVLEDATHTSRAALRPGTAAEVKRSASLHCATVSPVCFKRRNRDLSDNWESCAWSCGALRWLFGVGQMWVRGRHHRPMRRSHPAQLLALRLICGLGCFLHV